MSDKRSAAAPTDHDHDCSIRPIVPAGRPAAAAIAALERRLTQIEDDMAYAKRELRRLGRDER